jgi:hypothetical protein
MVGTQFINQYLIISRKLNSTFWRHILRIKLVGQVSQLESGQTFPVGKRSVRDVNDWTLLFVILNGLFLTPTHLYHSYDECKQMQYKNACIPDTCSSSGHKGYMPLFMSKRRGIGRQPTNMPLYTWLKNFRI